MRMGDEVIPPIIIDTSAAGRNTAVFHAICPRRLGVLLRGGHRSRRIAAAGALGVDGIPRARLAEFSPRSTPPAEGTRNRGSLSARSSARPIAAGPIPRHSARRHPRGPEIRAGRGTAGNQLPERREGDPPGPLHLRSRFPPRRLPLVGQADGRVESAMPQAANPKSEIPNLQICRQNSHRYRHRFGH